MKQIVILLIFSLSLIINTNAQTFTTMSFSGGLNTICDNLTPVITSVDDLNTLTFTGMLNNDEIFLSVETLKTNYSNIKVYPNPCTDFININIETDNIIQIFNITGKNIKNTYNKRINVTNLKTGIYILKTGNFTTKFIKN